LNSLDEKRLLVHLAKPILELPETLRRFPVSIGGEGLELRFHLGEKTSFAEVLTALTGLGHEIREIETQAPSLQEAFLKLTSRKGHA
jgi:hypothetical protein